MAQGYMRQLRAKRVFWRCSGGIALFRGSCVASTVESGDFEAD